jgi:hypothetical protein
LLVNAAGNTCTREERRYRFNKKSGKCDDFVAFGCGHATAGYASVDECEAHCQPQQQQKKKVNGKAERCNGLPGDNL